MVDHRSESHVSVRCSFRLGAATTTTSACHVPYHSSLSGALTPRPFAGNTRLCLRKTALLVRFMLADWVCESLTGQVESLTRACFFWQSPRLARTHCQNTCRALILVYLALRITAYAPRKEWCAPKGGARLPRWNPDSCTPRCADVRKVLLLPQRVQEPLGRLRLQAQPVQHAGLPLFCRWGASHPDSGCRAVEED